MQTRPEPADDRPRGRRPGPSVTRDAIAAAAAEVFAQQGYDRATIRAIATQAGVDTRLVTHWFGSKQELFVQVMRLPVSPEELGRRLSAGEPAHAGERIAAYVLGLMDDEAVRQRVVGLLRSAASEPRAADLLRGAVTRTILGPVGALVGGDDAQLRASLAASQMVGLLLARYVVRVEPLASAPVADLVPLVGPVLQRYLDG